MESGPVVILGLGRFFGKEHRIRAQVLAFSGRAAVIGFGTGGVEGLAEFHSTPLPPRLIYRLVKLLGALLPWVRVAFERWHYRGLIEQLRAMQPRLIIAHEPLDGVIARASGVPYSFDSHEYLPRQFDGMLVWRLVEIPYRQAVLEGIFDKAVAVTVEGDKVAEAYQAEFPCTRGKVLIVKNTPAYVERFPAPEWKGYRRKFIHHGILVPERGLELFLDVMARLGPDYELTLMGGSSIASYLETLKRKADALGNVVVRDPVSYERIVPTLHGHDLSFVFFGSPHYHHRHMTVPNKFYESLQARVPVVVSPIGAMADYVRRHGCGVVPKADSVESYVEAIRALTDDDIRRMKAKLDEMAWEHSRESWIDRYADALLERPRPLGPVSW